MEYRSASVGSKTKSNQLYAASMELERGWRRRRRGYLGLQQGDNAATQNVRFSFWNATEAQGTNCRKFDGEGIGQTYVLPVSYAE